MIWILLTIAIILLIWFSSVNVGVYYKRNGDNDRLKLEIGLFYGLIPIRKEIPTIKTKSTGEVEIKNTLESGTTTFNEGKTKVTPQKVKKAERKFRNIVDQVHNFHHLIKKLFAKVKVVKLYWVSQVGTGDAAETGILSGLIWGIKGSVMIALRHFLKVRTEPEIRVEPSFMKPVLNTEFECKIQFQVGNALLTGLYLLINWRRKRSLHISLETGEAK